MTKEDVIGQVVVLKEDFVKGACSVDKNAPTKPARPYLILQLKWKNKTPLFAVPIQTNVSDSMPSDFFEKLPKRLDTRSNCDCGLLFGQMIPITANFVAEKKGADKYVPRNEEKQDIVFRNLCFGNGDNISEDVKPNFQKCQYLMRRFGMSAFENKDFQNSYKIVANKIFEETLKIKDKKLETIQKKAQNYLDRYRLFYEQVVCKKSKNFPMKMPETFTRINKLIRYVHEQNEIVKTSLQSGKKKETKELTPKQIEIAKNFSDRTGKPVDTVTKVFEYIHNNDILARKETVSNKQKVITKTQEKNNTKPIVKVKKKAPEQNCR